MKESWEMKKFEELILKNQIGLIKSSKEQDSNRAFRYLKMDSITSDNNLIHNKYVYVDANQNELEKFTLNDGDFLFNTRNSYELVGKTCVFSPIDNEPTLFNKNIMRVFFKKNVSSRFINYAFSSEQVKERLEKLKSGTTSVVGIYYKGLRNLEIPLPPLPEQQRIVSILDEAFAAIDKAKANAEQNLQNAKELFESYLQGIILNGNQWEKKTLAQIAKTFGRGKSKHRPRNWDGLYGGKYPFIQTGDIRNSNHYITEYSQTYNDVGLAQSKLWPVGTICITIAANIAETGILTFDACFPDSVIGIEVNEKFADIDFVEYLLQSFKVRIQSLGKGSAQANINMGTFENEMFPFPTVAEQKVIVENLNQLAAECSKLEDVYKQKLTDLEELKKSILQKSFAGELKTEKALVV
jgi:type I restriction enzyme S subunit